MPALLQRKTSLSVSSLAITQYNASEQHGLSTNAARGHRGAPTVRSGYLTLRWARSVAATAGATLVCKYVTIAASVPGVTPSKFHSIVSGWGLAASEDDCTALEQAVQMEWAQYSSREPIFSALPQHGTRSCSRRTVQCSHCGPCCASKGHKKHAVDTQHRCECISQMRCTVAIVTALPTLVHVEASRHSRAQHSVVMHVDSKPPSSCT